MEPLVSVVMLSFNNRNDIGICLESLAKCKYKNMETIVLDCASKDGSVRFIEENFPWVNLVKFKTDPGPDPAYTYGVKIAKGNYVLLISADVQVLPDTVEKLVKNLQASNLDVAVPSLLNEKGLYNGGSDWPFFHVAEHDPISWIFPKLFSSVHTERPFFFAFACCLVKRDTYLETPFNQNIGFYEDVEWAWRLDLKGKKAQVLDDVYCLHATGSSIKGPRAIYADSHCTFPTMFICARTDENVFLFIPLATVQLAKLLLQMGMGRFRNAKSLVKGWTDAFKQMNAFMEDRRTLYASIGNKSSFNLLCRVVEAQNYKRKRAHRVGQKIEANKK